MAVLETRGSVIRNCSPEATRVRPRRGRFPAGVVGVRALRVTRRDTAIVWIHSIICGDIGITTREGRCRSAVGGEVCCLLAREIVRARKKAVRPKSLNSVLPRANPRIRPG